MKTEKKRPDYLTILREACLLVGFISLGYGIWSIFPPAAFIACGGLLLWVGLPRHQKGGD